MSERAPVLTLIPPENPHLAQIKISGSDVRLVLQALKSLGAQVAADEVVGRLGAYESGDISQVVGMLQRTISESPLADDTVLRWQVPEAHILADGVRYASLRLQSHIALTGETAFMERQERFSFIAHALRGLHDTPLAQPYDPSIFSQ